MALNLDFNPLQTGMWISDRRLFLTVDRSRVVTAEDPAAAFLLVGEGGSLPMTEAIQYGLVGVSVVKQELPAASPAGEEAIPSEAESVTEPEEDAAAKPKRKPAK